MTPGRSSSSGEEGTLVRRAGPDGRLGCKDHHIPLPRKGDRVTAPRGTFGQRPGASRPQEPARDDPRVEGDGRRIFTEDDLDGYFRAVDPRLLARDRRRRHRRHGIVLGLVALLMIGLAVTAVQVLRGEWAIPGWEASPPQEPLLCPAGTLSYAKESPVTVYNGTTIGGLAGDVANALEERRFIVEGVGNKGFSTSNMVAVIISGPAGRTPPSPSSGTSRGPSTVPTGGRRPPWTSSWARSTRGSSRQRMSTPVRAPSTASGWRPRRSPPPWAGLRGTQRPCPPR